MRMLPIVTFPGLRKVYVRLSSSDGANEVVGLASSGRALPQTAAAVG